MPRAPHEVLLVLDANQGQNALAQAVEFHAAVGVTGLVLTKLDGTARAALSWRSHGSLSCRSASSGSASRPVDFGVFDAANFVDALLGTRAV